MRREDEVLELGRRDKAVLQSGDSNPQTSIWSLCALGFEVAALHLEQHGLCCWEISMSKASLALLGSSHDLQSLEYVSRTVEMWH